MTTSRHGSATISYPSDREVLMTRQFDAPAALVFEVLTTPEHVSVWFAAKPLEVCEIDLRVGGAYRFEGYIMEDDDETCAFRGTYLEVDPPWRTVETWMFEGRPEHEAVETLELREEDGVTTMTVLLAFADQATRDSTTWTGPDGVHMDEGGQGSFDRLDDHLATLV